MAGWCLDGNWEQGIRRDHIHLMLCDLINAFNERWKFRHWTWDDPSAGYAFGSALGASWVRPTPQDFHGVRIDHLFHMVIGELYNKLYLLFPQNNTGRYTRALHWVTRGPWDLPIGQPAEFFISAKTTDFADRLPGYLGMPPVRMDALNWLLDLKNALGNMRYYAFYGSESLIAPTEKETYSRDDYTESLLVNSRGEPWSVARGDVFLHKGIFNETVDSGEGYRACLHGELDENDPDWSKGTVYWYYTPVYSRFPLRDELSAYVDQLTSPPGLVESASTIFPAPARLTVGWQSARYIKQLRYDLSTGYKYIVRVLASLYRAGTYANGLILHPRPDYVCLGNHLQTDVRLGYDGRTPETYYNPYHDPTRYANPHTPDEVEFLVGGQVVTVGKNSYAMTTSDARNYITCSGEAVLDSEGAFELSASIQQEHDEIDYAYEEGLPEPSGISGGTFDYTDRMLLTVQNVRSIWDAAPVLTYYNEDYE